MCLTKSPNIPTATTTPVTPTQAAKQPEQSAEGASTARKAAANAGGMAASTLLTGPSGVENSQLNLARSTLLGQ
jgi:hypothetical protein